MKHVVGFSGGLASAVAAKIVADENPDATVLLYHDTRTEPPDNDRFRAEVAAHIGLPITEVSDGRDIWQVFDDTGYLGNGRNTPCSRTLKQDLSLNYLLSNRPTTLYLGFTTEEWQRAQRSCGRYAEKGIEARFPLIEENLTKRDCHHRVETCWGIRPPQMYEWADHANCIPCVKGKLAYWGLVAMYEPEAWERAAAAEEEFGHTILSDGSLRELRGRCLVLGNKRIQAKKHNEAQGDLFELPCECSL